jgi:hypothetical protein
MLLLALRKGVAAVLRREWINDRAADKATSQEQSDAVPMSDETLSRPSEACSNKPRLRRRLQAIEERAHLAEVRIEELRKEPRRLGYQPSRFIRGERITAQEHD